MRIEVDIKKKYAILLLTGAFVLASLFFVYAVAQDTSVNHGVNQIDWAQVIPSNIRIASPTTRVIDIDYTGTGSGFVYQALRRGGVEKWWFISNPTDDRLDIRTPSSQVLTLTQNGNLGLGISNPVQKLDVSGNVRISGNLMVPSSFVYRRGTTGNCNNIVDCDVDCDAGDVVVGGGADSTSLSIKEFPQDDLSGWTCQGSFGGVSTTCHAICLNIS